VTITHLDGLVLARSAFNHSMNYRSAMVYGRFEVVDGDAARHAMEAFMEKLARPPGEIRPGSDKEYAATTVLRISLAEAACKVRSGGPNDDEEDLSGRPGPACCRSRARRCRRKPGRLHIARACQCSSATFIDIL
jgi:nitroimidazol reductase NimA-like FMN-containing flavoprotein (pyridoxamine 5'-phosphate oxidase superfamily)